MNTFDKQKVTKKIKPKERKHPPKNSPKNSNTKLQAGGLGRVGFSQEGSLWGNNWTALSMHKFIHTHTWIDHHDHPVSGQQAVANAGSRCPLLCCWPLPAACTVASHAVMWAKWKALTHTHTHKITTKWNNKKNGKRENKSLTVTDDEYRNRKK